MRNFLTIFLALLLFIASILFFAQNDSPIAINYLSGELNWQLNWVMLASLVIGFCIGVFSILGHLLQAKRLVRQQKIKLQKQEKELNNLRALPVKDEY
ncbi:LapA family protein [Aliikangiella maris]|uniref:LapA family protein n=2 Tax=Aliikangiella maris TaxID=3162458 RepID=A0ABV3MJP0_9GAMM